MANKPTLLITGEQVAQVLDIQEAVRVVEAAFKAYGGGRAQMPPKTYLHFEKGDLRCMPAYLPDLGLATVKNVSVHPGNESVPAVMATVTVFDPDTGFPLAVMDGTYLTALRTGAAGGVAAKYMARRESRVVCMVGAGRQAQTQLAALLVTMPNVRKLFVCDAIPQRARQFAVRAAQTYRLDASEQPLAQAVSAADIVVTVTPARVPVIKKEFIRPGMHINAVGADAPGKQELDVDVLQAARVVVDNWTQASHGGEINVAVSRGLLRREDVWADIGEVAAGTKKGRLNPGEVTVFDSTGLAIQDCACAAYVYRQLTSNASARSRLQTVDFLGTA